MEKKLKEEISKYFSDVFQDQNYQQRLQIKNKSDGDPVSAIDLFISDLVKREVAKNPVLTGYSFFSEEEPSSLILPSVILDPIDGTRELVQGIGECALSLAALASPRLGERDSWGWIWNPFSGFEIDSAFIPPPFQNSPGGKLLGLVSRTEWEKNSFKDYDRDLVTLVPRGSIAFKLGLLASGSCDFVLSYREKNLWDVAAGTLICHKRGISFFERNQKVREVATLKFHPPLLWCRERDLPKISQALRLS